MIRIRLSRKGRKGLPFFHIIVANSKSPRDGRFVEKIGWYNPLSKEHSLNVEKVFEWLKKGAQLTDGVRRFFHVGKYDALKEFFPVIQKSELDGLKKEDKKNAIKAKVDEKKNAAKERLEKTEKTASEDVQVAQATDAIEESSVA